MKKNLLAFCALTALVFASCQQDPDFTDPGTTPGGGSDSTRLMKSVMKTGNDSTVVNFNYTAAGKVASMIYSGADQGQPLNINITLQRNASGIITKQIIKSPEFQTAGIDSIVANVNYDAAASRYKSSVTKLSLLGMNFADSIVFVYDAAGKPTSAINYAIKGTGGYVIDSKTDYTYSGNNLLSEKVYAFDPASSSYDLEETYTYEYDTKVNPLQFTSEALILGMSQSYSANNLTKITLVAADPADNFIQTSTYTYNSANRPRTAASINNGVTSTFSFTYQ